MSTLIDDDALLDDMYRTLKVLRTLFMRMAEEHPDMDTAALDGLLKRYEAETGHVWNLEGLEGL
jgi:hypothetical protein